MPYLVNRFVLCSEAYSRFTAPNCLDASFLDVVSGFFRVCNGDQIRLAPARVCRLCTIFRCFGVRIGQAKRCIHPLLIATDLLCSTKPGLITSIHADLFLVCILSKCYSAVKDLLKDDVIYCIDPGLAPLTATDILLYFYYGGLLLTGRRQYKQASEFFLMAVTLPTGVTNSIMVAALKKLILVSFIHGGEQMKLPKQTSQPVMKALKSECGPYTELVNLAVSSKHTEAGSEISNFVNNKVDVWRADGNYGLIKLIVSGVSQRKILALSRLYYTLELPRLAHLIGFESTKATELKLMRMAETEAIHPSLSHREVGGMVEFNDNDYCYSSSLTMDRLHELTTTCMELATSLTELDHSISCSKAYLSRSELTKNISSGISPAFNSQLWSDDFGGDELMTAPL